MSHAYEPAVLAGLIAGRVGSTRPLIAIDNDGTLAPIAPRPDDARLIAGASEVLRDLADLADLVVISGRALDDLVARFADLPVAIVSEHGLRHRSASGDVTQLVAGLDPQVIDQVRRDLDEILPASARRAGWLIEDKGVTVAVHHRLVPDRSLEPLLARVRETLERAALHGGDVLEGKAVLELRPAGADKGSALRSLALGRTDNAIVMIGDDVTDEPALAFAERQGGIGVLVAEQPRASAASARVNDPSAVIALLASLTETLRRGR